MEHLPWHEKQWAGLERAWRRHRLPHALLVEGPGGLGKSLFALRIAALVLGAGKLVQPPRGTTYSMSQRAEHIWEGVSSATTRIASSSRGTASP